MELMINILFKYFFSNFKDLRVILAHKKRIAEAMKNRKAAEAKTPRPLSDILIATVLAPNIMQTVTIRATSAKEMLFVFLMSAIPCSVFCSAEFSNETSTL